jgi:hypothetical protein
MSDTIPHAASAAAASDAVAAADQAMSILLFGWHFNTAAISIMLIIAGILFMFWRIQRAEKLDFADMVTKDGRAVSLTKVLQLVGGLTATWVIVKLTLSSQLTEALFGLYLTYVGSIEGYSKYVAAKYGYNEKSVKDAGTGDPEPEQKP